MIVSSHRETMFDFSGDETLFLILAATIIIAGFISLYLPLLTMPCLGRSAIRRGILLCLPILLAAFTLLVVCRWADDQVKGHVDYEFLFLVGGLAWLVLIWRATPFMGISIQHDAVDRDNPAALAAVCGALTGASIIYSLANVGGGPTIWTTILPAFLATLCLLAVWMIMQFFGSGIVDAITIDRDVPTGLRCGAALLSSGIILGRAAGGVWRWPWQV